MHTPEASWIAHTEHGPVGVASIGDPGMRKKSSETYRNIFIGSDGTKPFPPLGKPDDVKEKDVPPPPGKLLNPPAGELLNPPG